MILVDGKAIPSPTEYRLQYSENRGTRQMNALGETVRDIMDAKRRVEIRYKRLSNEDAKTVFELFAPDREVLLKCPLPQGDGTLRCFVDAVHTGLFRRKENGENCWADVMIRLEEV